MQSESSERLLNRVELGETDALASVTNSGIWKRQSCGLLGRDRFRSRANGCRLRAFAHDQIENLLLVPRLCLRPTITTARLLTLTRFMWSCLMSSLWEWPREKPLTPNAMRASGSCGSTHRLP